MTDTHRFSVSVAAAVVRDDGKMLAIKRRDNGHWEPPGGVVNVGESLTEALVREVREETGYTVSVGSVSGIYQNMKRQIVALVFRCEIAAGEAALSDESSRVEWLDQMEVRGRMNESYAVRLLDALQEGTSSPRVRTHDGVTVFS
jgi:8-oxo-dGTP diphosphatase